MVMILDEHHHEHHLLRCLRVKRSDPFYRYDHFQRTMMSVQRLYQMNRMIRYLYLEVKVTWFHF